MVMQHPLFIRREDLACVCAGAICDKEGITGHVVQIDKAAAVWRPGGTVVALVQKRPWRAAYQGHEHLSQAGVARSTEPDFRSVARKAEAPEDAPLGSQRRDALRQVSEVPGPHLAAPDVELTIAVGEKSHELP